MKDVTAAIIVKDGQVLIARRAPSEKLAGRWEFPGGKIEHAETPEQCLERELLEELGIKTQVNGFFAESVYGSIRLLAYFADILAGTIQLRVHDKYRWVGPDALLDYDLLPADIAIAVKLEEVLR